MGYVKNHRIEVEERGYDFLGEKNVCSECVSDADLKEFITANLVATACHYCGQKGKRPIAASVDALLEEVAGALFVYWRGLDASDFFEGELMVPTLDTREALYDLGWPFTNEELAEDIVDAFEITDWVEKDPLRLAPGEALRVGWEEFSRQIRTVTRYLFFKEAESYDDHVDPGRILHEIHRLVDAYGLMRQLPRNTFIFRARFSADLSKAYTNAADLGPPPLDSAKVASRMTAAGIPVFYGALDRDTAIAETLAHATSAGEKVRASWGTFKTLVPMRVLDLTLLPPIPGTFSANRQHRQSLQFMEQFAEEVARPIDHDGREHIEYAPSQVVAEFFRHAYTSPNGESCLGILYRSSAQLGGVSCVLFLDAENCCDFEDWNGEDDPHWIALNEATPTSGVFRVRWVEDMKV